MFGKKEKSMNYPVESRERMPPLPTRASSVPPPEAYAQPHHRPQPPGMSEQDRLHLAHLLSRAESILAIQEEINRKHDLDKLADILYDLPYRHTMKMARGLTKVEGAASIGSPESIAAIVFKWAVTQRGEEAEEVGSE